jgi:type I restriction enzyme S subunit
LKKLQEEGLVTVDNDSEEDKTRIILTDPDRAEEVIAALPNDLKESAATIINTYGELDHNRLLRTVYEKYPAYARKSRLKRVRRSAHGS